MLGTVDPSPLDAANAEFIRRGVMVSVASRDANHTPSVARAFGCRVAPDRRRVTVFLAASQPEALLRDPSDTGGRDSRPTRVRTGRAAARTGVGGSATCRAARAHDG